MKTYYIEEKQKEMTYIELRLLLLIDCEEKQDRINKIVNYLLVHNFISNLVTLFPDVDAEGFSEQKDVMSLTIDIVNGKMRFKFWNGMSTFWLYHVDDVFDVLDFGRNQFTEIYDKYELVTSVLFDFQRRWRTSIAHITYDYHPGEDIELTYNIIFTQDVRKTDYAEILLSKINKEIIMLGQEETKDLHFEITHSFQNVGCTPCEKARKEREKNERGNKK